MSEPSYITRRVTVTDSSNIKSVGYAPRSKTLYVAFMHSGSYSYFNVPSIVFGELVSAESVGKHFSQFVRGRYQERKIK